MLIGGAITVCALAASALASSPSSLVVVWSIPVAIGTLLVGPLPVQAMAVQWFQRRRGLALGLVTAGTSVGGVLGPLIVSHLISGFGWRVAILVCAALVAVLVLPTALVVIAHSPEHKGVTMDDQIVVIRPERTAVRTEVSGIADVFAQRAFWLMVLSAIPMYCVLLALQHNLGPIMSDRGLAQDRAAPFISLFALASVIGKIGFGLIIDRTPLLGIYSAINGILSTAIASLIFIPGEIGVALSCGLLGATIGGYLPLLPAAAVQLFGVRALGLVLGAFGPFTALAAIGPWLVARVRESSGSYETCLFLVFAFIPTWAALCILGWGADAAIRRNGDQSREGTPK